MKAIYRRLTHIWKDIHTQDAQKMKTNLGYKQNTHITAIDLYIVRLNIKTEIKLLDF